MAKLSYKVPSALNRSFLDHEITLSKGGWAAKPSPIKQLLFFGGGLLAVLWFSTSTFVASSGPVAITFFVLWSLAAITYFGGLMKTKELRIQRVPAFLAYLPHEGPPRLHAPQLESHGLLLDRWYRRHRRRRIDPLLRRRQRPGLPGRRLGELPALRQGSDRDPRPGRLLLAQGRDDLRAHHHHHEGAAADLPPGGEPGAAQPDPAGSRSRSDRAAERAVRHPHQARGRKVHLDPPVPVAQGQEQPAPCARGTRSFRPRSAAQL